LSLQESFPHSGASSSLMLRKEVVAREDPEGRVVRAVKAARVEAELRVALVGTGGCKVRLDRAVRRDQKGLTDSGERSHFRRRIHLANCLEQLLPRRSMIRGNDWKRIPERGCLRKSLVRIGPLCNFSTAGDRTARESLSALAIRSRRMNRNRIDETCRAVGISLFLTSAQLRRPSIPL
jgi:hypothetical protein